MLIQFFKYQGTGNDFILLDNRNGSYDSLTTEQIHFLCDRRFGIGADGLMTFNSLEGYDFEMKYYNADGREGSMCGNGGRCIVKFASHLGLAQSTYHFLATDGPHEAEIDSDGTVSLKMRDVTGIKKWGSDYVLNTGSPHYIKFVPMVAEVDVFRKGRDIRYSKEFEKEGINVNFVEHLEEDDKISVRTYERGVENETYSCGTGVTAAAIVCYHNENGFNEVEVNTPGGKLSVEYDKTGADRFENIWLCGPAEKVFEGTLSI